MVPIEHFCVEERHSRPALNLRIRVAQAVGVAADVVGQFGQPQSADERLPHFLQRNEGFGALLQNAVGGFQFQQFSL